MESNIARLAECHYRPAKTTRQSEASALWGVRPQDHARNSRLTGGTQAEAQALEGARTQKKKEKLGPMMTALSEFLGDQRRSMSNAAAHLKESMGPVAYRALLTSVGMQHLSEPRASRTNTGGGGGGGGGGIGGWGQVARW